MFSDNVPVGAVVVLARGRDGPSLLLPDDHDAAEPLDAEPRLARFAESVNRSLVLAGLVAGGVGILLVLLLSRRVLGSIGSLTAAARSLGGGNLSSRVNVKGNDEIAELGHAFNTMADALEDSERQRRGMVSDVAHELRTPLANIQGHIEAIQDGLLQPDADTLDTVHQQTLYLNRLISDLSLLAQTEARELRLQLGTRIHRRHRSARRSVFPTPRRRSIRPIEYRAVRRVAHAEPRPPTHRAGYRQPG